MFKGHTKIELTDINTGETKTHEDDNMFTQAIYSALNNGWTQMLGGLSTIKSWHLPLVTKMLGGIALFSDTIAEDETQCYFPEDNEVLGYAGDITSDGSTKLWGSRNLLESEDYDPETKSVKYVWDFGTSQGNGTIKAIGMMPCKQPDYYGDSMWNLGYSRYLDATSYFSSFGYEIVEFDGDEIVWMKNGVGQVTINRSRFELSSVTLNETLATNSLVSAKTVSLPNAGLNYAQMYWKDGEDGYWYGFLNFNSNAFTNLTNTSTDRAYFNYQGSYYLQIVRINKATLQVEHHNITVPSYYVQGMGSSPIITDNYIIMTVSTDYHSWYFYTTNDCRTSSIRKDKLCFISKSDWTVAIREIVDEGGKNYYFCPNSYTTATCYYFSQILATAYTIKLPNGTYQLNDLILDNNGNVISQIALPISQGTAIPATSTSDTNNHYVYPLPFSINTHSYYNNGYNYYRTNNMVLNRKKRLILWVGRVSSSYKVYLAPMDCQSLITINNLPEPVTKTSTQSMKITYTVSDE